VGYVEPQPGQAFNNLGDSGSLVYAINNVVKVPLGLHIGKPATYTGGYATFVSFESFLIKARQQGIELQF
jgi:hypothetical protein